MTKLEALVGLNLVGGIGSVRLKKLLEYFDKPENILKAAEEKLMAVSGIGKEIAHKITTLRQEDLSKELKLARELGLEIIAKDDLDYPSNLKQIYDPPIILYVKGRLIQEDDRALAIVGSRRASLYGRACAEKFATELAQQGITIVSGMARGIDTCAHRGALNSLGRTIAVIGSGFKYIYPEENKELAQEIARNGAVVSEFPISAPPLRQNFPRRNRIISGLVLGVLVVEAARNSGALITADFALEQGREVFALPGELTSRNSFGTNGLIKQGAKLVSCIDDIMEELDLARRCEKEPDKPVNRIENITDDSGLYELFSESPINLDEIAMLTKLDIPRISDILVKLQLQKLIKQLPGKQFIRTNIERIQ